MPKAKTAQSKSTRRQSSKGNERAPATKRVPPRKSAELSPELSPEERILAALRRIPRGRVSTYGDIASVAGLARRARLVGTVLRQTPAARDLPWFRVINASGRSSLPEGSDAQWRQWRLLRAEGVEVRNGRVDLQRYGWPSREHQLDELLWKI
jgi:methylated-DNA-protein-cysteine methyltransferase related protein